MKSPDVMIGNGVQVSLTDGAELGPGGSTTVTLSYATAPADVTGKESAFVVWEWTPETGWVDIGAQPFLIKVRRRLPPPHRCLVIADVYLC